MNVFEILIALATWTPYLAVGFVWNLIVSVLAMWIGTPVGWLLGRMRASRFRILEGPADAATALLRSIPSLVFLFYLAFVLPVEFTWEGTLVEVPPWFKATLALAVPVMGFTSDNILELVRQRRAGTRHAWTRFWIAYAQYFLIIIMASSTASVIGANEIVGRANTVIAALDAPEMMLWTYVYVSLYFLMSGLVIWRLVEKVLARVEASEGGS